ncbi:MAG TPA: hypothetical protein VJ505_09460 [Holophagaceae bacterium]|nr:hypothetical protein [Holophagaceae bacterium]
MIRPSSLATLTLVALLACGGGGGGSAPAPQPAAPKLVYTDPTSGAYRFLRNVALSTDAHLVLDLVGPTGAQGRGVAFTLTTDASMVTWSKPQATDAELVAPALLDLGSAPQILKVKAAGATLQAAYAQKGTAVGAKALDAPFGRVALTLKPGAHGTVTLSASAAQVLPASGAPQDITLACGTLQVQ